MGRARTIARRTFLVGSAAIAGGVAFGAYAYKKADDNPLLEILGEGETAITPYVKIESDGITLITPQTDVGQGAYSVQAALIAEELDVDLDKISVDPGPPSAAYANTAVAAEALPLAATDDSAIAQAIRTGAGVPMKVLGLQITGGSSSVPNTYVRLRKAGATARETLKLAASKKTGVPVDQMKTENAQIILPDGSSIPYTEIAPDAALLEPVQTDTLRDPSQWRYLGKPMQRIDITAKSTGTQEYGIDRVLENMVYATVRKVPGHTGSVKNMDDSAARNMRGIKDIIQITGGVAVIADNTWRAFQAAEALVIEWDKPAYPPDMEGHWSNLSNSFTDEYRNSRFRDDGDVEEGLSEGGVFEAEYRAPYVAHAPLEPLSATVLVTDGRVDVWTTTQIPVAVRDHVARLTGVGYEDVHLHVEMAGGSFGNRLEADYIWQAVEIALFMKGTPVKLTLSREEDFQQDFVRQIAMARLRGRVSDGKVHTFDMGIAMPSTLASQMGRLPLPMVGPGKAPFVGPDILIVAGAWDAPYAIPNHRVTGYRAPEIMPVSWWRSVGASTNGFFYDCALDELIHEAGADPLEERIRLTNHEVSRKVLEAVGEMSNWGSDPGKDRARGVAFCLAFGVPTAEVIEITKTSEGIKIDKVYVAAEVGRIVDPINLEAQLSGGIVWGLGHAMNCEITYDNGIVEQNNFHAHEGMRLYQCPEIEVRALENGPVIKGVGEAAVPPAAPALANAIFSATGQRIREMPFNKFIDFV